MRRPAVLMLLALLLISVACEHREFEVTMKRTDDGTIVRTTRVVVSKTSSLSLVRGPGDVDDGDRDSKEETLVRNLVRGKLPSDLEFKSNHNRGFITSVHAPLGDLLIFVEQMPGVHDPLEIIRAGEKFADTLVAALTAYVEHHPELYESDPARLEALKRFLKVDLRDDVLRVMLLLFQDSSAAFGGFDFFGDADADDDVTSDIVGPSMYARLVDFLVARDYVTPAEAPAVLGDRGGEVVVRSLLRKAGHAMGYQDATAPAALLALANEERASEVLHQGLASIGVSEDEFSEMLNGAVPIEFGDSMSGTVRWECDRRPLHTNGKYDASEKAVLWRAEGRVGCAPPRRLYAVWATPNEAAQRRHFGSVCLEDDDLMNYLGWRQGFTDAERKAWDAFVKKLEPGPGLVERISVFRFAERAEAGADDQDDAPPQGAEIICKALRASEETASPTSQESP